MISSASGVGFGGSSLTGSQPIGGEPGGEIKKFFSNSGTFRWLKSGTEASKRIGLRSAKYTRSGFVL